MRSEGSDDGVGSLAVIGVLPRDAVVEWSEEIVHPSRSGCKMLAVCGAFRGGATVLQVKMSVRLGHS